MRETTQAVMLAEMGKDEKLLWSGQPRRGVALRPSDMLLIPFSLAWGGFAFIWEAMAIFMMFKSNAPPFSLFFPIFGIPLVLLGVYLLFGRFIADSVRRARTHYGVTDQRVIIVSGIVFRQTKSLALGSLAEVTLSEKSDKSGTIVFGPQTPPFLAWFGNASWPGLSPWTSAFEMIQNARKVHDLLREAQSKP